MLVFRKFTSNSKSFTLSLVSEEIIYLVRLQNFPKKLTLLTPSYAHVRVRMRG